MTHCYVVALASLVLVKKIVWFCVEWVNIIYSDVRMVLLWSKVSWIITLKKDKLSSKSLLSHRLNMLHTEL